MSAKPLTPKFIARLICLLISFSAKAQMVPQFTATPLSGCAPLVVNFTDATTGGATQWKWDLGNSTVSFLQNPSATYLNPGTYTVKLVVTNAAGTKDSITKINYITVHALPAVNFTATPLTGCYPLPVTFTDMSTPGSGTITNWLWDFGDGNSSPLQTPSHVYTASGNYNVSLQVTNSNGCTKTLTKTNYITISNGVHAAFTNSVPAGCSAPETITFNNGSTGTGTLSYDWHFGDGGTSTAANPTHTYTSGGTYTVQLIITNSNGCKDTATHTNAINIGSVHAAFTAPSTACANSVVSFTNTSTPPPVSVIWYFGDATTSTVISPSHVYATDGVYFVKMVADFGGCKDSVTKTVTILEKPVSAFTANPLSSCSVPHTVNFNNSSTGGVGYEWYFGDGNTSATANPVYTYTTPGTYTVTLITTNANGCKDTVKRTNYIKIQLPQATINNLPQEGCAPFGWTFNATVNSIDPVTGYHWDFGDGGTSTAVSPSHVFAAGTYTIQLIITTASGCKDTVTVPAGIVASIKPHANFGADPRDACAKELINFHDSSTGTIDEWHWLFGDGAESTVANPTHQYEDTGFFNVTLIVGNHHCYDTLVLNNYVHIRPPIALFNVPVDCNDHFTRVFTDHSIGADEWHWDFGDGQTSTVQNPVHTYSSVGTYTVTLTVINHITGCDHTHTTNIVIADEHAAFTADQTEICRNTAATFTATSVHAVPDITNYFWDFGDGVTATGQIVSHIYTAAGTYNVRLIITDVNGCTDTLMKNQYIKVNGPTAGFVSSVPGSCLLTAITFNDQSTTDGTHPITSWHWYYGDGNDEVLTGSPFQHSYNAAGIYSVALVVQDSYGCRDSLMKPNMLTISTPVAAFASADTASCPGKNIVFTNASTGPGLTYHWDFGDGQTSTSATPTHVYAADGNYTVNLTITDQYNCTSTEIKNQYIKIKSPVASFTVSDSVSTCPPLIVQFTNTSVNMETWTWDFGDGNTSSALSPSHFYNVAGTYIAKLTITGKGGCTSVKTKTIRVKGPSGTFTYAPVNGCSPLSVTFTATTIARSSFIWDFNDGNTMPTTDSVVTHVYTIPGNYVPKMILLDPGGCTVAIQGLDTIKVNGVLANFSPDTTVRCTAGDVIFTDHSQSNDVITGYSWNFGDGQTSTAQSPTHYYSAEGIYTATLTVNTQAGCSNTVAGTVPIKVVRTPDISFTQSANGCTPLTIHFDGVLNNADTSAIAWNWNFSDGTLTAGQHTSSFVFTNAGVYTSTLIAINSSGCRDTATNTFEVYGKPQIGAGNDIAICEGTGQTLNATGGAFYTWSPATGLSCTNCPSPVANPIVMTDYTVTGQSIHGCVNTDIVRVDVNHPFHMQYGPGDTLCVGSSKVLTASGAASYAWSPSAGLNTTSGNSVTATPLATTDYMVVGFDGKNCFTDTAHFIVKIYPIPVIEAGADKTINVGQTITITPAVSSDVNNVVWSPSTGIVSSTMPSVTVKPTMDMTYKATATNAGGCVSSDNITIHVLCNGANVYIPNTFSPNADGANDIFYPRGTGLFTIKQARIFNRWGEEVYEKYSFNANDAKAGWDGTFKGKPVMQDVYVYMFEIQCENNTTMIYKGNVTLIK